MSVAVRPARVIGVIPARPKSQVPPRSVPAPQPACARSPLVEYGTRRILVVAGVMLAALLQTVDLTIVNVALPTIQGNLGATVDEATWVLTGYVVANVVVIPLTPWLQLRFGRKNYFLVSIAGFTAASMLCGMATSLERADSLSHRARRLRRRPARDGTSRAARHVSPANRSD